MQTTTSAIDARFPAPAPFGLPGDGDYPIRLWNLFYKDAQLVPSSASPFDAHDIVTAMSADGIMTCQR